MRVVVESQAEVPDVVHAVLGLHHGSESHGLDEFLLALALAVVHELVNAPCHGAACAVGLHLVTEFHDEFAQVFHLLRVGIVVYSVGQSLGGFAFGPSPYALGHGAVGQ